MADRQTREANTDPKTYHPLYTTWFVEYADKWKDDPRVTEPPRYSMEEFHQTFLNERDPTEYRPAIKCLGSWDAWCRLKKGWPEFRKLVDAWQVELEIKLRSDAMERLTSLMDESNASTQASIAKFVATLSYDPKTRVGRPSKEERERIKKEALKNAAETEEEASRIMEVIQGGRR